MIRKRMKKKEEGSGTKRRDTASSNTKYQGAERRNINVCTWYFVRPNCSRAGTSVELFRSLIRTKGRFGRSSFDSFMLHFQLCFTFSNFFF